MSGVMLVRLRVTGLDVTDCVTVEPLAMIAAALAGAVAPAACVRKYAVPEFVSVEKPTVAESLPVTVCVGDVSVGADAVSSSAVHPVVVPDFPPMPHLPLPVMLLSVTLSAFMS